MVVIIFWSFRSVNWTLHSLLLACLFYCYLCIISSIHGKGNKLNLPVYPSSLNQQISFRSTGSAITGICLTRLPIPVLNTSVVTKVISFGNMP